MERPSAFPTIFSVINGAAFSTVNTNDAPSQSILLMEDGLSFILLEDGVSYLMAEK